MKRYFLIVLLLTYSAISFSQSESAKDFMQIGHEIKFSSEKYQLTRTVKPYNNYFIQEYIRPSENTQSFTKAIVMMVVVDTTTTDHLLALKIKELDKLREKQPNLIYEILLNEKDGRMIEFILSDEKYLYWNIQRFSVQKLENGQDAAVIYTYIEKKPLTVKNTREKILKSIKEKRVNYITEVGETEIPKINLKK